jgi:hypothetical protein
MVQQPEALESPNTPDVSLKGCSYVVLQFPARLAHTTWAMENLQELRSSKSKPKRRNRSEISKSDFILFSPQNNTNPWLSGYMQISLFFSFLFFFFLTWSPSILLGPKLTLMSLHVKLGQTNNIKLKPITVNPLNLNQF